MSENASQDLEATRRALKESFMEPDPSSLGIGGDYFGSYKIGKERLKVLAGSKRPVRFMVPWWIWLVFAGILVFLALLSFGLGAACVKRKQEAEASEGGGGFRGFVASTFTRRAAGTKGSKEDLDGRDMSMTRRLTEKPIPELEDFSPSAGSPQQGTLPLSHPQPLTGSRCLPCLPQQCGTLFTRAVRRAIAAVNKKVIGVALHVGEIRVDVRSGQVDIENLILDNPEGYKSEYLLMVGRLSIQVSMAKYIFSRGKNVVVESLSVVGVELIYEKALTTSNFEYVLDFADKNKEIRPTTITRTILGAVGDTSSFASSSLGTAAGVLQNAVVGEEGTGDEGMMRSSTMGVAKAVEATAVGRLAKSVGMTAASTATDVLDRAAGIVGTTVAVGATAVSMTTDTVESQLTAAASAAASGAMVGARALTSGANGALSLVGAASSSTDPPEAAPAPEEKPIEPPREVTFIVKRLSISNIGVTVASSLVGGRGVRLSCSNINYTDFNGQIDMTSGLDIVKFLLKTTLLNAIKSLSSLGEFTLETTGRYVGLGRTIANEVEGVGVRAFQHV